MAKKADGLSLPAPIPEPAWPGGDGPTWVSAALGMPGVLLGVTRYRSDDAEATALVLHFTNGAELFFRPARLIVTRRLIENVSALGFPVPYYSPPQIQKIGQAIGRIADAGDNREEESITVEYASLVTSLIADCLISHSPFVLYGRAGRDVRAAILHVRDGINENATVPLIVEPHRNVLLIWTMPVRAIIRDRFGTAHDAGISLQLQRAGLKRHRLAARPAKGGGGSNVEMPCWEVPNGWKGLDYEMPEDAGKN